MEKLLTHAYLSILRFCDDKFGLYEGLCKTDDGRAPTRIHAIVILKFYKHGNYHAKRHFSNRTVSVYQFTEGLGVERGGEGRGRDLNFRACVSGFVSSYEGTISLRIWSTG
jgi:hypothetical protein